MGRKPTYTELKQRVEELEEKCLQLKRAQETLGESENTYGAIAESSLTGIYIIQDRKFVFVNKRFADMHGISVDDMVGHEYSKFLHPEEKEQIEQRISKRLRGEKVPDQYETRLLKRDGKTIWCEVRAMVIQYNGSPAIMGNLTDITDRKRAEEALRESKELFEKTYLAQRGAIFILNSEVPPKIKDCNPAATDMFGYTRGEMLGRTSVFLHVSEESLKRFQDEVYPQIENRGYYHLPEFEMKRKDGAIFPTEHSVVPLTDENGERIGWVSVIVDITDRKRAEEALRESEVRFREMADNIHEAFWLFDWKAQKVVYISPAYEVIWGRAVEALYERYDEWTESIYPEDLAYAKESFERIAKTGGGEAREYRIIRPDGSIRWVSDRGFAIYGEDGEVLRIAGIAEDVTERKQAEEALRESEVRYRQMVEHAPTAIYEMDPMGYRFTKVNDVVCNILGYTEEELLNMDPGVLFTEESKQLASERTEKIRAGQEVPATVEYRLKTKDGREIWALVNSRIIYEDGKPVKALCIAQDISERRKLEEQLFQAQKMKAVGTMASGVAHNFRNVLAVISMQSQIVEMKYGDNPELQEIAERINTYVERGAQLVDALMQFSRKQTRKEYQPVNLAEVIRETHQLMSISFDKMINIRTKIPESLPIIGDHSELGQVLMNLYTNARDAMPKGGELRIEASKQGGKVVVAVSDTGHGMDKETQERCFDPFFTTKEITKGTGLGLSTTYGIVKEHSGEIQVSSKLGRGTTFKLYFPLAPSDVQMEQESPAELIRGKGQKILIVDDEEDMSKLLQDLLETLGYQATSVNSGKAAIVKYKSWKPDAVLLDRNMPEMDGISCAEHIVDYDHDARILIISGYDEDGPSGMAEEKRRLIKGYLTKPIMMKELNTRLAQLFE